MSLNNDDQTQQNGLDLEKSYLAQLLKANLDEQRRSRRWGLFFKGVYVFLFAGLIAYYIHMLDGNNLSADFRKPHVALIDIKGAIADSEYHEPDLINSSLNAAFETEQAKAIILRINSPGGSPVQSAYLYDEITRLRKKHPLKKVYAVFTDVGASGAYYIACAADEIYANASSIVGSIGVISIHFGFEKLANTLGVESRIKTAGKYKFSGDPFRKETPEEAAIEEVMINGIHAHFIDAVKKGRGKRLSNHPDIFSGRTWIGSQALELGLIDGLGSAGYVAREIVKINDVIDYTVSPSFLEKFASRMQGGVSEKVIRHFSNQFSFF